MIKADHYFAQIKHGLWEVWLSVLSFSSVKKQITQRAKQNETAEAEEAINVIKAMLIGKIRLRSRFCLPENKTGKGRKCQHCKVTV